jgi:ferrous iron transport protein A
MQTEKLDTSANPDTLVALSTLQNGQTARIGRILGNGDIAHRLREMGLTPGSLLKVLGRAPLSDPMSVRLRNTTLALRRKEARDVLVELMNND